jgi:hypothetical protein
MGMERYITDVIPQNGHAEQQRYVQPHHASLFHSADRCGQ